MFDLEIFNNALLGYRRADTLSILPSRLRDALHPRDRWPVITGKNVDKVLQMTTLESILFILVFSPFCLL